MMWLVCTLASLIFGALKLLDAIAWSWWWVATPLLLALLIEAAKVAPAGHRCGGMSLWDWLLIDSIFDHHHHHDSNNDFHWFSDD